MIIIITLLDHFSSILLLYWHLDLSKRLLVSLMLIISFIFLLLVIFTLIWFLWFLITKPINIFILFLNLGKRFLFRRSGWFRNLPLWLKFGGFSGRMGRWFNIKGLIIYILRLLLLLLVRRLKFEIFTRGFEILMKFIDVLLDLRLILLLSWLA